MEDDQDVQELRALLPRSSRTSHGDAECSRSARFLRTEVCVVYGSWSYPGLAV